MQVYELVNTFKEKGNPFNEELGSSILSTLLISSASREEDEKLLFEHKIDKYPPSLTAGETMRQGQKSDIIDELEMLHMEDFDDISADCYLLMVQL